MLKIKLNSFYEENWIAKVNERYKVYLNNQLHCETQDKCKAESIFYLETGRKIELKF